MTGQNPQLPNPGRRDEAAIQPAILQKLGDSLGVPLVTFASLQRLQLLRISQEQGKRWIFEDVPDWHPVDASGLHGDMGHLHLLEPGPEGDDLTLHGAVAFADARALGSIAGRHVDHGSFFVSIKPATAAGLKNR